MTQRLLPFLACLAFAIIITLAANYLGLGWKMLFAVSPWVDTLFPATENEATLNAFVLLQILAIHILGLALLVAGGWLLFRHRLSYLTVFLATMVGSVGTVAASSLLA